MSSENRIPLEEKFRILTRIIIEINERNYLRNITSVKLTQNQFLILKILNRTGSKSVSKLAELLNVSRSASSKNIDYLVKEKLIDRIAEKQDRRFIKISILYKGKKIIEKFNLQFEKRVTSILSSFDVTEKKQFNQLLDKYIYHCLKLEGNLSIFCAQCGKQYEGNCPITDIAKNCFFQFQIEK